ncbi:MAG: glycyl-tRNA synthetase [Thermoproteota archaeon]|nr:glycyl-tRNA synthetase [Thermoproteota archaeon]
MVLEHMSTDLYDKISNLGKRRGIIFPAFEIYGGVSGFFDYGPVGALLKRNIEDRWRDFFVNKEGMVELESSLIMPSQVFEASGHLSHFTDIMTKCTKCNRAYRTDNLLNELGIECREGMKIDELDKLVEENSIRCPECGGALTKSEPFNLMFQVKIGSYGGSIIGYGRPEVAQGQFVNFKRIYSAERERLPLGIAQIGRCVRNEIAPRKGPIRLREFTIIDYEIFMDPENTSYSRIKLVEDQKLRILPISEQVSKTNKILEVTIKEALEEGIVKNQVLCYFMALAVKFLDNLGIPSEKQRLREQLPEERAHYSSETFDQEVWLERWGWTEVSGHAYRSDYDLRNHMAHSGVDLRVYKAFDQPKKVIKAIVKPRIDVLETEFSREDAQKIISLISKGDQNIIERELKTKGFYELTGLPPIRLELKHVEIIMEEVIESGRSFIPHVVEPSFGIDRIFYSTLEYAFAEKGNRMTLKLPKEIAPISAGIFPLVSRDGLPEEAKKLYELLQDEGFKVRYDESDSIGRRYARADEIGVPLCITIDYQTLQDKTVTLRDINTWKQIRNKSTELPQLLREYFKNRLQFDELGKPVEQRKNQSHN